jgi:hypothetical protein
MAGKVTVIEREGLPWTMEDIQALRSAGYQVETKEGMPDRLVLDQDQLLTGDKALDLVIGNLDFAVRLVNRENRWETLAG